MDKGFVRSLEVMLAAIMIIALYTVVLRSLDYSGTGIERNPEPLVQDLIDSLDKEGILTREIDLYNFNKIESLIRNTAPESLIIYLEGVYYTSINILGLMNQSNANLSFSYVFPEQVDKNSIRILDDSAELQANVVFPYYVQPLNISGTDSGKYLNFSAISLGVTKNKISQNTLSLYIDDTPMKIDLETWNQINDLEAEATIISFIPKFSGTKTIYLYYGTNESLFNQTYYSYTKDSDASYTELNIDEGYKADIAFKIRNTTAGKAKKLLLEYSLFSSKISNYARIDNITNQNAEASTEFDILKHSTATIHSWYKGNWLVQKNLVTKEGISTLKIYIGYI